MPFFKYTSKDFIPKVDTELLMLYEEFRELFNTRKSKMQFNKEMLLIWYCVNVKSPGVKQGLNDKDLLVVGAEVLELEDWVADDTFKVAMNKYKEIHENVTLSVRICKSLYRAFSNTYKIINTLSDIVEDKLEKLNVKEGATELTATMNLIISSQKDLLIMAKDIPKQIESLKEAEAKVIADDELIENELRGGGKIRSSMMPENV
jgi:hypothetical protein